MRIRIDNGRILDPPSGTDCTACLLIEDGRILSVMADPAAEADRVISASGMWVMPGLIDLHVHFREPGFEDKETILTGAAAAVHGGFTAVCPMANTRPVTDTTDRIRAVLETSGRDAACRVYPVGACTLGMEGSEVTDMAGMKEAGAGAVSEDGKTVMDAAVYRRCLEAAAACGLTVLDHAEDKNLSAGGCMDEGEISRKFGVKGISRLAEDVITARDILLAADTGARLHFCHVSTKGSTELIRQAKAHGIAVTAEVCPHHFTLTSADMPGPDPNWKMAPPLRTAEDVEALLEGLRDGTIDAVSTDHAPHTAEEKARGFEEAPCGIVGLETAVPLAVTRLVRTGVLSPLQLAEKMSTNPARILGVPGGSLAEGGPADITIVDPDGPVTVDSTSFRSKGRNTPFDGRKLFGAVVCTIVGGRIVFEDNSTG